MRLCGNAAPQIARTSDLNGLPQRSKIQGQQYTDRFRDISGDDATTLSMIDRSDSIMNGEMNNKSLDYMDLTTLLPGSGQAARDAKKRKAKGNSRNAQRTSYDKDLPDLLAPLRTDGVSGLYGEEAGACERAAELGIPLTPGWWQSEVQERGAQGGALAVSEEALILGPYGNGTLMGAPQSSLLSPEAAPLRPTGLVSGITREALIMGYGPNSTYLPAVSGPAPVEIGPPASAAAEANAVAYGSSALVGSADEARAAQQQQRGQRGQSWASCANLAAAQNSIPTSEQIAATADLLGGSRQDLAASIAQEAYIAGIQTGLQAVANTNASAGARAGVSTFAGADALKFNGATLPKYGGAGGPAQRALGSVKAQQREYDHSVQAMRFRTAQALGLVQGAPSVVPLPSNFPVAAPPGATTFLSFDGQTQQLLAVTKPPPPDSLRYPYESTLSYVPGCANDILSGRPPTMPLSAPFCSSPPNGSGTNTFFAQAPTAPSPNTVAVGAPQGVFLPPARGSLAPVQTCMAHAAERGLGLHPAGMSQARSAGDSAAAPAPANQRGQERPRPSVSAGAGQPVAVDVAAGLPQWVQQPYSPPDARCSGVSQCSFLQCLGLSWAGVAYAFKNFDRVPVVGSSGAIDAAPSAAARLRAVWTENDRWVYILAAVLSVVVISLLIALLAVAAGPKCPRSHRSKPSPQQAAAFVQYNTLYS